MLTINSEEISEKTINYGGGGFSPELIHLIKETIVLFQHFSFSLEKENTSGIVELDGLMLGKPEFKYLVSYFNNKENYGLNIIPSIKGTIGSFGGVTIKYNKSDNKPVYNAYHEGLMLNYSGENIYNLSQYLKMYSNVNENLFTQNK
jgi:hypothetical protein